MKEKIIEILSDIKEDVDFATCKTLIDDGIFTSLDIIQLVAALGDEFDITVPASDIVPRNFNSIENILSMVQRLVDDD